MKKFSKKILSLLLSLVLAMGGLVYLCISPSAETGSYVFYYAAYPRGAQTDPPFAGDKLFSKRGPETWGHPALSFLNGWSTAATDYLFLHSRGSYSGPVCYCLEPGPIISQSEKITGMGREYWNRVFSSQFNSGINGERFRELLSVILENGYKGNASTTWVSQNAADADKISLAFATQLLVWELCVGERDANFNHINVSGCNRILDELRSGNPLRDKILSYYNSIEATVKGYKKLPSFCYKTKAEAEAADPSILEWDGSYYSVTLTDTNNCLSNYSFSSDEEGVQFVVSGNKLTIKTKSGKTGEIAIKANGTFKASEFTVYTDGKYTSNKSGNIQDLCEFDYTITENATAYLNVLLPHIHVFIPEKVTPTCVAEGYTTWTCSCGVSYTTDVVPCTKHDYANSPWVIGVEPTCTTDGEEVQICEKCNFVIDRRTVSATGHGKSVWIVDYEATTDHDGQMTEYCSVCGEALSSKTFKAHTHTPGYTATVLEPTCTQAGKIGTFCETCGACYLKSDIQAKGHTDAENSIWVTKTEAGCETTGEKVAYCKTCGEKTGSKTIPALGHTSGVWTESIPATCTTDGESLLTCDRCSKVLDSKAIPAHGHDEGVWVTTKEAGCELDGEKVLKCTTCRNIIDSKKIAAHGHDEGVWKINYPATVDHDGQMGLFCTGCNMLLDVKNFKLHEHEFGYKKVTVEPTCTRDGRYVTICKHCGVAFESENIPMLGHSLSEWYTNNNGTHSRTCSICHYEEIVNCECKKTVTERTCTTWGYTENTCEICNFHYKSDFLVPLGHNFGKYTDTGDGCTHIRYCSRCNVSQTELHEWSEWKFNKDNTFFKQGTKTRVCIVCGAVETDIMHHSSVLCRIFYPLYVWMRNIMVKVLYPAFYLLDVAFCEIEKSCK